MEVPAAQGSIVYSKSPSHKENNMIIAGGFNLLEASKTMDTRYVLKQKSDNSNNVRQNSKITNLKEARLRNRSSQSINQRHMGATAREDIGL